MKNKLSSALNIILSVISCVIIAFSLIVIVVSVLTPKDKYPRLFGYSVFKVQTESMEPTVMTGDVVFVKLAGEEEKYAKDEIITFFSSDPKYESMIVTHRVYKVTETGYQTWGDNRAVCPYRDEYEVGKQDIIGRVVLISPFLGKVTDILSNKLIFALIVIVPLAFIEARILIKVGVQFRKEMKESAENDEEKQD